MNTPNLIRDRATRYQRNADNRQRVTQFLIQETYSTIPNLMVLLNYQKRQPLDRLLAKLRDLGVIKKYELKTPEGKLALWGITDLGLAQDHRKSGEIETSFYPYRLTSPNVKHKLQVQRIRLYLEKNGWSDWQSSKQESVRKTYQLEHKPDGLIKSPSGRKIAIETISTLQQVSRYRSILKSYIQAKENQYCDAVFFIVESPPIRALLEARFDKVKYIRFNESKHPFENYRSKLYRVFTVEEMGNIQEKGHNKKE